MIRDGLEVLKMGLRFAVSWTPWIHDPRFVCDEMEVCELWLAPQPQRKHPALNQVRHQLNARLLGPSQPDPEWTRKKANEGLVVWIQS